MLCSNSGGNVGIVTGGVAGPPAVTALRSASAGFFVGVTGATGRIADPFGTGLFDAGLFGSGF
jgi:hypothetical protein